MYCRHCGDQIPVDSMFCPSCGKNLLPDDPAPQAQASPSAATSSPRTPAPWMTWWQSVPWRRYRNVLSGVIQLNASRLRAAWTLSQILFVASAAFSIVGFVLSMFQVVQGLAWLLFGLVLGLSALYTKGPPHHGNPPSLGG